MSSLRKGDDDDAAIWALMPQMKQVTAAIHVAPQPLTRRQHDLLPMLAERSTVIMVSIVASTATNSDSDSEKWTPREKRTLCGHIRQHIAQVAEVFFADVDPQK